ncbi:MAG: preprotein translocase subunit SecG [Dongiaceae bacterium]
MQDVIYPILLAIHLMLAATLIGVVLLQKSEGGLGGLGGGGGMSGFMTGRGTANLLTKTTRWLAAGFMATSLALAWLTTHRTAPESIIAPPTTQAPALPTLDEPQTAPAGGTGTGAATPGTAETAAPAPGTTAPDAGASGTVAPGSGTTEPAVPTTNQ